MQAPHAALAEEARAAVAVAATEHDLHNVKSRYLGKNGVVQKLLREVRALPPQERAAAGAAGNALRQEVEEMVAARRAELAQAAAATALHSERIDVTLPGRAAGSGSPHPAAADHRPRRGNLRLLRV